MPADLLTIEGLVVVLGGRPVVDHVSLSVARGERFVVVGPNGSGKTTLLRAIHRAVTPREGRILLDGTPIEARGVRALAREVAVLRQESLLAFDFTVEEVVRMGRSPHQGLLSTESAEDRQVIGEVLALTDTVPLVRRRFSSLSGGERQRVMLARALAQRPKLLLLDEPTNHLDIGHQLEILASIRALDLTVVAALHDLNAALGFGDRGILLDGGRPRATGSIAEVLEERRLGEVFGVEAEWATAPGGKRVLAFEPRRRVAEPR